MPKCSWKRSQQEVFVKFTECLRITFSKNIPKMFCDNLLKTFSDNIAWTLGPNILSVTFSKKSTCIYIVLFPVLATFTHSHTHPYTDDGGCHARCQLHIRSNLGFSIFLKANSTRNLTEPGFKPVTFWSLDNLLYTHIHTLMTEAAMQSANCMSGAIWGSVFSSRPLQHAAQPSPGELGFEPVTFWSLDNLLYKLNYSCPKHLVLNVPECSRHRFSKNIPKMFCDNLLKMFSHNITWTLGPNVLENILSGKFLLSSQSVRG